MTTSNSIRCDHCNLLNFADSPVCKRCKNPLGAAGQGSVININVNLTNPVQRVNINSNAGSVQPKLTEARRPRPEPRQGFEIDDGSYQPQNQTGFQQWKEIEQNQRPPQRPPMAAYPAQPMPPVPFHPSAPYQMMMPSVWRHGDELVVHKMGVLPDTCVKCNQYISGGGYSTQKYRWHNPLVYIAIISPLIYVILALALSQRGSISVPLCHEHTVEKEQTGKTLLFGGIGAFILFVLSCTFGYPGFAFLIFLVSVVSLIVGVEYFYKPLRVSKIENDYLYLKGAASEFLDQFNHG